jgi:hypothetical protein
MHQAAIRSLGLVEDRLRKLLPEKKMTYQKEKRRKEGLKRQPSQNETSESSGNEKRQTRRERCKEYNSTSKSEQSASCVERRKL